MLFPILVRCVRAGSALAYGQRMCVCMFWSVYLSGCVLCVHVCVNVCSLRVCPCMCVSVSVCVCVA